MTAGSRLASAGLVADDAHLALGLDRYREVAEAATLQTYRLGPFAAQQIGAALWRFEQAPFTPKLPTGPSSNGKTPAWPPAVATHPRLDSSLNPSRVNLEAVVKFQPTH